MATLVPQEFTAEWGGALLAQLNKRAETLLREMDKVPDVQCAFICDARGNALVLWYTIPPITREAASRVGACMVNLWKAFPGHIFEEIEMHFEDRWLYARTLGNAFLVVVCTRDVNRALLRMTCNVAAVPFQADKELQKNLSARPDIGMRLGMGSGSN